jgi:hypothetical protein
MTESNFIKEYGSNPFFLFAREVVGGEMKDKSMADGFKLLDDLKAFFIKYEHYKKAENIDTFRAQWKQELKKEFSK